MLAVIADDDRMTTAILAKALRRWNVESSVVHDGLSAWTLLSEPSGPAPSLALIDWMMPGIDGLELCRRIRQTPALSRLYVIMLTGRDSRKDMVVGLDAGADDYIVKPFDAEELRARVQVGIRVATLQESLAERVAELQAARDELARLASTDPLTGLSSRRTWFEMASMELSRARRYGQPLAVLMADLDYFKRVNDTFGHNIGDDVLKRFADVLRLECRQSDVVGRIGGEEVAILLPQTSAQAAQEVAQRIIERCRTIVVKTQRGDLTFSCSVGVTEAAPSDLAVESILERADEAMYQAKRNGRNGVYVIGGSDPRPALQIVGRTS